MHPAGPIELCKSASIVPSKVLAVNNEKLDNAQYDIKFEEVVSIQSIENKQNINCKYHMHGKCTRGNDCPYLHESSNSNSIQVLDNQLLINSTTGSTADVSSTDINESDPNEKEKVAKTVLAKYSMKRHIADISKDHVLEVHSKQ